MDVSNLSDNQLQIAKKIILEAQKQGIEPDFALATAYRESQFNPSAKSPVGATGVMQLMPKTAEELGVDHTNIDENIYGGVKLLKKHLDTFGGDKTKTLIAYNAGPSTKFFKTGNVKDLPSETLGYVKAINELHPLSPPPKKEETKPIVKTPIEEKTQEPTPKEEEPVNFSDVDIMGNPTTTQGPGGEIASKMGATLLSGATGLLKPFGAVGQYLGINAPANKLEQLSQETSKIGGTSANVANVLGQVASPLPIKGGNILEKGISNIAPKLGQSVLTKGATQAGVASALNPVQADSYKQMLEKHIENLGTDVPLGAISGKVGQTILNPKISEKMQMLKDLGMKDFTPGQLLGFQNLEKKLTSLPLSGWMVQRELQNANQEMNKAIANKALEHIGEKLPKDVKAGSDMMGYLQNKVSSSYDDIAQKINFLPDKNTIPFLNAVANRAGKSISMPASQDAFYSIIRNNFFEPLFQNFKLSGTQFRTLESDLGSKAYNLSKSSMASEREVGNALLEFQDGLRKELARVNPNHATELKNIHEFFKKYKVLEKASSSQGAVNAKNIFDPEQLSRAATQLASKSKKATSSGLLQPEAQNIMDVMGKKVPDSGTAGRIGTLGTLGELTAGGLGGLQGLALPTIATGALYNPLTRRALSSMITGTRPKIIQQAQPEISGALARAIPASQD